MEHHHHSGGSEFKNSREIKQKSLLISRQNTKSYVFFWKEREENKFAISSWIIKKVKISDVCGKIKIAFFSKRPLNINSRTKHALESNKSQKVCMI